MRLIVRKERPHPGAQLRITDADGMRITCFATNTPDRPIAELELRHRLRARAEDRIRAARTTGLRNLPLHHTAQNRVWLEIVQIALDLLAWTPMLALTDTARLREPRQHPPLHPPLALEGERVHRLRPRTLTQDRGWARAAYRRGRSSRRESTITLSVRAMTGASRIL